MYYAFIDPAKMMDYCGAIVLKYKAPKKLRLVSLRLVDNVRGSNKDIKDVFYTTVIYHFNKWLQPIKHELQLGLDVSTEQLLAERFRHLGYNVKELKFSNSVKVQLKDNLRMMMNDNILEIPDPQSIEDLAQRAWLNELIQQMKEQEGDFTGPSPKYFHPQGRHDDLLTALEGAAYLARRAIYIGNTDALVVTKNYTSKGAYVASTATSFPELERPGVTIEDIQFYNPSTDPALR